VPGNAFSVAAYAQGVSSTRLLAFERVSERIESYATTAIAKPPHACSVSVSRPSVRCSWSANPQDRRSSDTRSRDGGALSTPNVSGSPAGLVDARAKRWNGTRSSG